MRQEQMMQKKAAVGVQQDVMGAIVQQKTKVKMEGCECKFDTANKKRDAIAKFIKKYGDNIPEKEIKESVKDLKHWQTICDCNKKDKLLSIGRFEKTDWYLCTLKNLATHKDYRGMGLASQITKKVVEDAINSDCLMMGMDITVSNKASMATATKYGFKPVSQFCWAGGKEPANVMHWVRYDPMGNNKCLIPKGGK